MTERVPVHSDARSFSKANVTENVREQQRVQPALVREHQFGTISRPHLQGQTKCMRKQDDLSTRTSPEHKVKGIKQ